MPQTKITWILVGAPNSGKTSLFNRLTGSSEEVMNYPGSTAITHKAKLKNKHHPHVTVIDTPGIYGLGGESPEETEVQSALKKYPEACIIFVLDSRFIDHRIQFLSQLLVNHFKCVVYCTHVSESGISLTDLHETYGASFIDSHHPLALKTLIYAIENIGLQIRPIDSIAPSKETPQATYDLDRLFLHPILSFVFALAAMTIIFSCVFYIAQPISNQIEGAMDIGLGLFEGSVFAENYKLLASFISGGILGLGTLLIFTPQIFLLFVMILFIQESGYLARAAVILDPILQKFGLHGKSFVPLLSGFSCAIPAILLSKTIESKKERLLTILAVPFMMCSARVPMYAMCVSFLLHGRSSLLAGLVFAGCYFFNLCLGIFAAGFINKLLPQDKTSYFMMELPPYRLPSLKTVARSSLNRVLMFVRNAGPIILGFSLIIWGATTFPNYDNPDSAQRLKQSYAGQFGRWLEPVFKPMGTDWRVGTAVLTSFAAREVFVSSLTLLLGDDPAETSGSGSLKSMRAKQKEDGTPLFSHASIFALLIFFMFALQCSSTTAITAKETGSWKIATYQFLMMNGLAYALAVITYQLLSRI